jgi:hypothetical protein
LGASVEQVGGWVDRHELLGRNQTLDESISAGIGGRHALFVSVAVVTTGNGHELPPEAALEEMPRCQSAEIFANLGNISAELFDIIGRGSVSAPPSWRYP